MPSRAGHPALAPAKVNLTLHVTGRRADGYHQLDSLVVFAGIADRLAARLAPDLNLSVNGPFAEGVPSDGSNLVLRAAALLREARGVSTGAAISLEKHLPHPAGLGGGSSDAAAALALLAELWRVAPLDATDPRVLALGADVPVCMSSPRPVRMTGIGETLSPVPALPAAGLVLVNPRVNVPTRDVFAALAGTENAAMEALPARLNLDRLTAWLGRQRNDLTAAAVTLAPEIGQVLDVLTAQPKVRWAGMSGSGATCVGLVSDVDAARRTAQAIQLREPTWWVVAAPLLG
ncbi:MAG: 4-(cytidine 5'-diphospho)-2-C-methyl-D-erythritol kinase [Limimaricola sp.]|uniref:4-(cytidine 5'-diphospho)-2-C-methyl-D-erythritol kinase n=1 Tax=Limimaricola sp. TaxID=2211665 RepID=UPI001DF6A8DC|nr:4-(cytidine 5'-diphospho)-2-C-methyl-D-erythritol kinase [Limimaricola sp.]MBI1417378.1 4-(cytidine 5'-diphospho)-2-C-methyl-D-erythritol kinase [Limimaricola sp.]